MRNITQAWKIRTAVVLVSALLWTALAWRTLRDEPGGPEDVPARMVVEVKGEVPAPGIYLLERDHATVSEAVAAAGRPGGLAGVDRKVEPGESLTVAAAGPRPEVATGRMPAAATLAAGLKIDLNSAGEKDFLLVPRMRPEVARQIVEKRGQKAWDSVGRLVEIPGVGPKTVESLDQFLRVGSPAKGRQAPD